MLDRSGETSAPVICPACSGQEFGRRDVMPRVVVSTCGGCGLLISELEPPESAQSEFSRVDADAYNRSVGVVRQLQAKEATSLVRRYHPGAKDWLDIGCGFGHLLQEAQRVGYQVAGNEPDVRACSRARQVLGEDLIHLGVMSDGLIPDGSVDVVSMMDVLEHLPAGELSPFAEMIGRKLRSDGTWVIKVPSTDGLYFTLGHQLVRVMPSLASAIIERLWQLEYEFPHTVYFNERSLRTYLENHGFEPVAFRYLSEVPTGTVKSRFLMDDSISRPAAYVLAAGAHVVNLAERLRGSSDALLVLARRRPADQ